MTTIKSGVVVLLTLCISIQTIDPLSAASLSTGYIKFRGAIVEPTQCKPLPSLFHKALPTQFSIQCERSEMASRVTVSTDDDVVVWRYLSSEGKGILLSKDSSHDFYRITFSYF